MSCPKCGAGDVHRSRRNLFERIFWSAAYRCAECGYRERIGGRKPWGFVSTTPSCPRCGDKDLKKFTKRDHIEGLYRGPLSTVQALLGAPLLYCKWCRLQFYDFRPRRKDREDARTTNFSEREVS